MNHAPFNRRLTSGFSLVELLVALGVGMYIVSLAFASLSYVSKTVKQTNILASKNDAVKQALMWNYQCRSTDPIPGSAHRVGAVTGTSAHATSANLKRLYVITSLATVQTYDSGTGQVTIDKPIDGISNAPVLIYNTATPTTVNTGTITSFSSGKNFTLSSLSPALSNILSPAAPTSNLGIYETIYVPRMVK